MKNFLNFDEVKDQNQMNLIQKISGFFVMLSFIFANAFQAQSTYYAQGYQTGSGFSVYFFVVTTGILYYLIYLMLSNILFSFFNSVCLGLTGKIRQGMKEMPAMVITRPTYKMNLNFSYFVGNIILGAVSLLMYFDITTYYLLNAILKPIALLITAIVFYALIATKLEKKERLPFLLALVFPFAILLLFT